MNKKKRGSQKGLAPLLLILVIAILGVTAYLGYQYFKPTNSTILSPSPTSVGQFCGGIEGVACPEGYTCKYDGNYPDAGGTCLKSAEQIPAITDSELSLGWYWGTKDQKKPGTPSDWVFEEVGKSSCWHKPEVNCSFLPD